MPKIDFTEDEAEILIDALETDLEGYVEAAKDARANMNRADVATFTEAAERIQAVIAKVRKALG
jgi:glutathione synthase/RimK-type ligase-like ATP-grasp enzyme